MSDYGVGLIFSGFTSLCLLLLVNNIDRRLKKLEKRNERDE